MGERKVLNKYIPSDFDPSLVPKFKNTAAGRNKKSGLSVRMMIPFSMQCLTCGSFMYRGRKFNSKKEDVQGEKAKYLGIQRYRFYIKCTQCARSITFLTDPENGDYEMEDGAKRNFESWKKDKGDAGDKGEEGEGDKEVKENTIEALEERVMASRREMKDMDELEEIRALNDRHIDVGQVEDALKQEDNEEDMELNEHDEEMIRNVRFGYKVKRLDDAEDVPPGTKASVPLPPPEPKPEKPTVKPPVILKRKRKVGEGEPAKKKAVEVPAPSSLSLLGGYGSDSESD